MFGAIAVALLILPLPALAGEESERQTAWNHAFHFDGTGNGLRDEGTSVTARVNDLASTQFQFGVSSTAGAATVPPGETGAEGGAPR